MQQQNVFIKGILDDLHPSHVQPDNWVFPTHNIRIYNKRGQGFVVSGQLGNEKLFEITPGYSIVAAQEHRDIVYIVSVNNEDPAETEIGTYPTPKAWYKELNGKAQPILPILPDEKGFIPYYGAIRNYSSPGNTYQYFRTHLFGYKKSSNVKLIVDSAFDESVNMYLCDGENIDKVVNSGFRNDGSLNSRPYTASMVEGQMSHIPFSVKPPSLSLKAVEDGGFFRPGQYFLYFSYQTGTFDSTEWYQGPTVISIPEGSTITSAKGEMAKNDTGGDNRTSKKIVLTFNDADFDWKYLIVGLTHVYSDQTNLEQRDVYKIAKRYSLSDLSKSKELTLFGNETEEIFTEGELYNRYLNEKISTDHIISNQRMFKANLNRSKYNRQAIADFAKLITVSTAIDSTGFRDPIYKDIINNPDGDRYNFQIPETIEGRLGYIPEEIYPFGIIGLFPDGTYSEVFPIRGQDFLELAAKDSRNISGGNDKGLVRFKKRYAPGNLNITFNLTEANKALPSIKDMDIKAIYIVRGDRIKNFLGQGFLAHTGHGVEHDPRTGLPEFWFMSDNEAGAYSLPYFRQKDPVEPPLPPGGFFSTNEFPTGRHSGGTFRYMAEKVIPTPDKFALFTPDQLSSVNGIVADGDSVYIRIDKKDKVTTNMSSVYDDWVGPYAPEDAIGPQTYQEDILGVDQTGEQTVIAVNVPAGTYKGKGKFSSYVEDGEDTGKRSAWREASSPTNIRYNRSYVTPSYVGITGTLSLNKDASYIATIKKTKSDKAQFESALNSYLVSTSQYSIISNVYYSDKGFPSSITLFKGDCFYQRVFTRVARHYDYDTNEDQRATEAAPTVNTWYYHGRLVSYLCDSAVNSSLRNYILSDGTGESAGTETIRSFFPACLSLTTAKNWIFLSQNGDNIAESFQINQGYNKTLDTVKRIGYDSDLPEDSTHKPTRIAFSSKFIAEAFFDNYRSIGSDSYQDYSTNNGAIQRLANVLDIMASVRDYSVEQHFVGQKKQTASEQEVVLSPVGIYLSEETSILAHYGIQNFHSIVMSKSGMYGIDKRNELLWRLAVSYTDNGKRKPGFELISRQMSIDKKVKELVATLSKETVSPLVMDGVSMGFNEEYGEIYWTFLNGDITRTMVFNESLGMFMGTSDVSSSFYTTYKKGFISTINSSTDKANQIYIGDSESSPITFYGTPASNQLSFIINGNTKEENTATMTKIFESLNILSPHKALDKIDYRTESQTGTYIFTHGDSAEFWKDSVWREGIWIIPIMREIEDNQDSYYQEDSLFRDRWLKVTLHFKADMEFYISNIISKFNISFS